MSEALALDAAWFFAAFLVLVILLAVGIAGRRYLLERGGGTVECGLRKPAGQGAWRLGVASYQREELDWYRIFGISMRAEESFPRRDLAVLSRRAATPAELSSLGPGRVIVECQLGADDEHVELALAEEALTGLLAWLEAAPPGSHLGVP